MWEKGLSSSPLVGLEFIVKTFGALQRDVLHGDSCESDWLSVTGSHG